MEDIISRIHLLFSRISADKISSIVKLPESGGDRKYYRFTANGSGGERSYIATFSTDVNENRVFISWSRHFFEKRLSVPVIYAVADDNSLYIQEDLGDKSLLDIRLKEGDSDYVFSLYKKSLLELARLQILGDRGLDYSIVTTSGEFGREAVLHDLLYFKFYFVDTLKLKYDREKLLSEFQTIATELSSSTRKHFMFRDFQGRNIMVRNEEVFFIDYQGGMKGPAVYDAASLLWQAKADLSPSWRAELFEYYVECLVNISDEKIEPAILRKEYQGLVLLRLLQVLGAYGFRGLFERKQHFISSIPKGIENLSAFKSDFGIPGKYPELNHVVSLLIEDESLQKMEARSAIDSPLLVTINSFSFTQRGYPPDATGNGGGFVFDCRGILNPGRIDEYKSQTGRDEPVKVYLEQRTRMPEFLRTVYDTVDIAVENYIERGFENLTVSFGCTGGRHRSVYAADSLAKHLREKYKVRTSVNHLEQNYTENI